MNRDNLTEIQKITLVGILAALVVIIKQFTITVPVFYKLDFSHIIVILVGFLFGPFIGGIVGFLGDFLGGMLKGWGVFPIIFPWGFMLVGILAGFTARFNKNKISTLFNIIVLYLIINFIIEFTTYSVYFAILGTRFNTITQAAIIYYPARLTKTILLLPVWLLVIPTTLNRIKK